MDLEKMGKFIAKLRTDKGLTQVQLGDLLGVENKTISKWEKGIVTPDTMMLIALSNVFDVRVEEIVDGEFKEKFRNKAGKKEQTKVENKSSNNSVKFKNISIVILLIFILLVLGLLAFKNIKGTESGTITIDLKNDPETPLNVSGCIMNSSDSAMYVIKGISYETKGDDQVGKTLIKQYELKLLVDDKMVGTYTHNFDANKALDDAIDNLAFTVESGRTFDKKSRVKIQIKYTTLDNDKEIIETDLFV